MSEDSTELDFECSDVDASSSSGEASDEQYEEQASSSSSSSSEVADSEYSEE